MFTMASSIQIQFNNQLKAVGSFFVQPKEGASLPPFLLGGKG